MGMPGSETALEELMCRVLGELLQAGAVAKLADDLYWGGNTPTELLDNWTKLLLALHKNNPHLSASKTILCQPKIHDDPGLDLVTMYTLSKPTSYIRAILMSPSREGETNEVIHWGVYSKVLARVIPACSSLLAPLDDAFAGLIYRGNFVDR
jgi:hypothetical protein